MRPIQSVTEKGWDQECLVFEIPLCFAHFGHSADRNDCLGLTYRSCSDASLSQLIFMSLQQAPGTLNLRQLEISVDNIATSRRARDYRPLRTDGHNLLMTNGHATKANDALEHLALQSLTDHTIALEGIYDAMLREMEDLSTHVKTEEADLKAIQTEVESFSAPLR